MSSHKNFLQENGILSNVEKKVLENVNIVT